MHRSTEVEQMDTLPQNALDASDGVEDVCGGMGAFCKAEFAAPVTQQNS